MNHLHQQRFFALLICLGFTALLFGQATPVLIGVGQNSDVVVTTSNTQAGTDGANTLSNEGFTPNNNAASRFLQQASFGPNYSEIMALSSNGLEDWLEQQFALPRGFNCVDKVLEIRDVRNAGTGDPDGGAFLWLSLIHI